VREIANVALGTDGSVEAFEGRDIRAAKSVEQTVKDAVATIGENMNRAPHRALDGTSSPPTSTTPLPMGWASSACSLPSRRQADKDAAREIGRQVAMHVAATNPLALTETISIPAAVERERKAIFSDQARESGKPDNIIEKMVEGRMRKFYEEVCFLKQAFVMNPDLTVEKALKAEGERPARRPRSRPSRASSSARASRRKKSDFAAEVAAAAKG
jgi:elongation factor Ts